MPAAIYAAWYARLSERDMYSPGVFTALGYFVYLPDIVFRPREPG